MRVLVATASKHGGTTEIGEAIGKTLADRGFEVIVRAADGGESVEGYAAVVVGSAVYAGQWLKAARHFVEENASVLVALPVWMFSSGPVGDPLLPEEDTVAIDELLESVQPREHRVLAGKLIKSELGFAERAIASAMRAPEGDFRDWDLIAEWAGAIADELSR
jgi:menaquinone-dependent protoporphyrinogen oxidase